MQVALVQISNTNSQPIPIRRGVCQGRVRPPILDNRYSESIFNEAPQELSIGIRVGDEVISKLGTLVSVLLVETLEDL